MKNDQTLSAFAMRERPAFRYNERPVLTPRGPDFNWTDERVEFLKKLWAEGISASGIASRLIGPTRNAVIGKIHRLGLSGRATTSRMKSHTPRRDPSNRHRQPKAMTAGSGKKWAERLRAALKPRAGKFSTATQLPIYSTKPPRGPLPLPPPHADDIARISYAKFIDPMAEVAIPRNACRWPIGEPMTGFCGCEAIPGKSYCGGHLARSVGTVVVTQPRPYSTTGLAVSSLRNAEEFLGGGA